MGREVNATAGSHYRRERPIVQEAGWAPGPVWTDAENLAPPGIDPQTVQPVACSYTDCVEMVCYKVVEKGRGNFEDLRKDGIIEFKCKTDMECGVDLAGTGRFVIRAAKT